MEPKISVTMTFEMTNFRVDNDGSAGTLWLTGFTPVLILKETNAPREIFNKIQLTYPSIPLSIFLANGEPKVSVDLTTSYPVTPQAGIPDSTVILRNGWTLPEYELKEQAILMATNTNEILGLFADSITVPNILPALIAFKLSPPFQSTFIDEYLVITGISEIQDGGGGCRIPFTRDERRNHNEVRVVGRGLSYPSGREVPNHSPDFFFYFQKDTSISMLSESILKPAIADADAGNIFPFRWHWNAAGTLHSANVTINNNAIVIDTRHLLFGNTGFALKIGCIYQQIVGASFNGEIDPSKLTLTPLMDTAGTVHLHCEYRFEADVDIALLPIVDIVLNAILDSLMDKMLKDEYEARLKMFNTKLLDLSAIPIKWQGNLETANWEMAKMFKPESFILGFKSRQLG